MQTALVKLAVKQPPPSPPPSSSPLLLSPLIVQSRGIDPSICSNDGAQLCVRSSFLLKLSDAGSLRYVQERLWIFNFSNKQSRLHFNGASVNHLWFCVVFNYMLWV